MIVKCQMCHGKGWYGVDEDDGGHTEETCMMCNGHGTANIPVMLFIAVFFAQVWFSIRRFGLWLVGKK